MIKKSTAKIQRNKGGRPSQAAASLLRDRILETATDVFFAEGYGHTTIEEIATRAKVAKRTIYARFKHKQEIFAAVVQHVVKGLTPTNLDALFAGDGSRVLVRVAQALLAAALKPHALALHRIMIAEAVRFPELMIAMQGGHGRDEALRRISEVILREAAKAGVQIEDPLFAAEQFFHMVVAAPQRRAMGLGTPLTDSECVSWAERTVQLFLFGLNSLETKT